MILMSTQFYGHQQWPLRQNFQNVSAVILQHVSCQTGSPHRLEWGASPSSRALLLSCSALHHKAIFSLLQGTYSPGGREGVWRSQGPWCLVSITRTASLSPGLSASSHNEWAPCQPHPGFRSWCSIPGSLCPSHLPSHRQSYFSPSSCSLRKLCLFQNQTPGWPWISQASVNMQIALCLDLPESPKHGINPPFRGAAPHFPGSPPVQILQASDPISLNSLFLVLRFLSCVSWVLCCFDIVPHLPLRATSSNGGSELVSAFPNLLIFAVET